MRLPKSLAVAALVATIASFGAFKVQAQSCSSVVTGAGSSPPDWAADPSDQIWQNSCFVDFGSDPDVSRDELAEKCRSVPGYLQFNADHGSGHNTCIFRPGSTSGSVQGAPVAPAPLAETQEPATGPRNLDPGPVDPSSSPYARPRKTTPLDRVWSKAALALDDINGTVDKNLAGADELGCWMTGLEDKRETDNFVPLDSDRLQQTASDCVGAHSDMIRSLIREELSANTFVKNHQPPQPAAAPAYDQCIHYEDPHRISSSCDFKDGVPMFETAIKINPNPGLYITCPRHLTVGYAASAEPGMGSFEIGTSYRKLWTCGSGPISLHVVPD